VTDIHHDRMDDGSLGDKAERKPTDRPLPKECPKCAFLRPPKVWACPSCGFKPERRSEVDVEAGELIELDGRRKGKAITMEQKIAFIGELRRYQADRGKQPKWVDAMFRQKFGTWPNHPSLRYARPADYVGPEVRNWITSRAIAYARSKGAAQ
jgi:DNA repair protein RadD